MSHLAVDSILPANLYNKLIIDHEATERAELLELKSKHIPALFKILSAHGVAESLELHLLYRHFVLQDGEAVVHRTIEIPDTAGGATICVDIAKAVNCPESVKDSLVPILWMVSSSGSLIAYEYGFQGSDKSPTKPVAAISPKTWDSFAHEFSAYVRSTGIADIVSLKDKSCINGGEYVVPGMRVLFRVPIEVVNLQPGSGMIESGWNVEDNMELGGNLPECTDGHVTKTRQTTAGTVAHYHDTTEAGVDAFNPKEVASCYTDAMWVAAKSKDLWALGGMVHAAA